MMMELFLVLLLAHLIGTIERWLILIFVCLQRYDALGLLIAAKSIIRFSEAQNKKSEYVLAGTLLSIFIAAETRGQVPVS